MWAVNLHRLGFEMVGLWPKSKCTKKSLWPKIWIGVVFILLIFVSNIPMICAVIEVWGNMILVIDNLHTTLPQLIISIKYVIFRRKQTGMFKIIKCLALYSVDLLNHIIMNNYNYKYIVNYNIRNQKLYL